MGKINIAEFLKDCPSGMELDCTLYEDVYFDYIDELCNIYCYIKNEDFRTSIIFNRHGRPNSNVKSKCVIFPKGKTTWEGFVPPCKFKVGNWYQCTKDFFGKGVTFDKNTTYYCTREGCLRNEYGCHIAIVKDLYDNFKLWTIQDAKDGDVISYDNGWTCIFKCIHGIWYSSYCFITDDGEFYTGYERHDVDATVNGNAHPATKEQRELLFQKMKEAGYKWDAETKTLEKLVEPIFKVGDRIRPKNDKNRIETINYIYPDSYGLWSNHLLYFKEQDEYELVPNKFDIKTLVPFDSKVLVRDDYKYEKWRPAIWGYYDVESKKVYSYEIVGGTCFRYCIPYEGNEHLLGTINDCNDYYKTWEE